MTHLKPGNAIHKVGGRYGGPGRIVGVTDELDADGYRLYSVAMAVAGGYGEFVHVFPASALSDTPDPRATISGAEPVKSDEIKLEWRDGAPPHPWEKEWFIAETTYGDRVVLKALPEEYTYDFKTADETYIKRDKIKRWMQFPDSNYIAPDATTRASDLQEALPYPRELTDNLRDVLSMMMWNTGSIAHVLRAGGAEIPNKAEIEQAHVLHWLTLLALEHSDKWREEGEKRIQEIRAALDPEGK